MGFFPIIAKGRTLVDRSMETLEVAGNGTQSIAESVQLIANNIKVIASNTEVIASSTLSFVGNLSAAGQAISGAYACNEGLCGIVDGVTTVNPIAKVVYLTGGSVTLLGGIGMLTGVGLCIAGGPFSWASTALAGGGYALKRVDNYIIDRANGTNPLPTLTKVV